MDMYLRYIILFVFLLCKQFFIFAQNDLAVDDYSLVCETTIIDIDKSLNLGVRAFQLELEEIENGYLVLNSEQEQSLDYVLGLIQNFLRDKSNPLVSLIFIGNFQEKLLQEYLNVFFPDNLIIDNATAWPKIDFLQEKGIQVLVIFERNLVSTSILQVREGKKHANRFSSDPLDKLILFESTKTIKKSVLLSECLHYSPSVRLLKSIS